MTDALDIATRAGLPDELRVLAARYPRADWKGHANFSDLTAFWLDRHLMFRGILGRMQATARAHIDAPQPRFGPEIARYTGFLLNQLHEHHGIEDHYYFPKLMRFDPRLARAFEMLDADHHALEGHIHGLAEATNAVLAEIRGGAAGAAGPLLARHDAFERFLNRHLADEEEVIVPIILEYAPEIG